LQLFLLIIANKIVERANFILENWNQNFIADNYYGNTYYRSDWFNKNSNISIQYNEINNRTLQLGFMTLFLNGNNNFQIKKAVFLI
jgi:type I restriction-modification system DNA methylase subunit